jgi:hypothetical protein
VASFDEVMAMAALPERVVPLIVAGDHLQRIAELEREIANTPAPTSLGDRNPVSDIIDEIERLMEEMRGSEVEFHLRAVGGKQWDRLTVAKPMRQKDETTDSYGDRWFDWMCIHVAATCTDPVMTPQQVAQLAAKLPGSSWDRLGSECWSLNSGEVSIPFFVAGSARTPSSGETSRLQPASASPSAGSAAKSRPARRRTSTTTPAV